MEIGHRVPEGASQPPAAGQANGASVPINELDLKLKVAHTDLVRSERVRSRLATGYGAEVAVRHGQLMLKPLHPVPAIRRGMRLYPDDRDDPWAFRVEMPEYGVNLRVVFSHGAEQGRTVTRLLTDAFSFQKRPDARNPRRLVGGTLLAGATAIAVRQCRERQRLRALIPAHLRSL
jgi:hypothetical protein